MVTVDPDRRELTRASVLIEGTTISAIIEADAPAAPLPDDVIRIDGSGCVLTPGLVNTHHHLYQWITRGLAADHTLLQWLTTLYPIWAGIDEDAVRAEKRFADDALA